MLLSLIIDAMSEYRCHLVLSRYLMEPFYPRVNNIILVGNNLIIVDAHTILHLLNLIENISSYKYMYS